MYYFPWLSDAERGTIQMAVAGNNSARCVGGDGQLPGAGY